MPHEMFDDSFFLPSDKDEVESLRQGRLPIPTSREYGVGAVVFPTPQEARKDAFASGMIGGRNNPEAAFGRLARVNLRPENPLIIKDIGSMPQYRAIADKLEQHYDSDETKMSAEETLRKLTKRGNNPYQTQTKEDLVALNRAKQLMTVEGKKHFIDLHMRHITQGNLGESSKLVDTLKLPNDAVGDLDTRTAVAKRGDIVNLKDIRPLR